MVLDALSLFPLILRTMNKKSLLVRVNNRVTHVATSERIVMVLAVPYLEAARTCKQQDKKRKEKKRQVKKRKRERERNVNHGTTRRKRKGSQPAPPPVGYLQ